MLAEAKPHLAWLSYHCRPLYCVRVGCVVQSVWMAAMMPAGDIPRILAFLALPCCVAFAWLYVDSLHVVILCSGIDCGWWARDRLGAAVATTSTTAACSTPDASAASSAGGFAGEYEDPQSCEKWVIKDACEVIAVRESDGKDVWGWSRGAALALQLKQRIKGSRRLYGAASSSGRRARHPGSRSEQVPSVRRI